MSHARILSKKKVVTIEVVQTLPKEKLKSLIIIVPMAMGSGFVIYQGIRMRKFLERSASPRLVKGMIIIFSHGRQIAGIR